MSGKTETTNSIKSGKSYSLKSMRRVWSIFFMALFLFFIVITDFRNLQGYQTGLFLEINPLVWFSGLLSGWTVYKGLALALLVIVPTFFLGRFFCSWICPLGILNQWASRLLLKRGPIEDYGINEYKPVYRFKYYLLALLLILSALGSSQIGLFDPVVIVYRAFIVSVLPAFDYYVNSVYIKPHVFLGGILISLLFLAVIMANRFITRLWCRMLCPLGALLGLMSAWAPFRIRRDVDKCTDCNKCLRACQGASDPQGKHRVTECVTCMNCITDCPEDALSYGLPSSTSSEAAPLDINRRRLLETTVAGLVLFPMLKSSITGETSAQAAVIRPPGSLNEPDFLRRCIKCSMCMRVCPTNALHPSLLEAGLEGLWSPIVVNKIGYCEFHCTLCGQVCPTGAIEEITVMDKVGTPSINPIKLGTAFFDRGRCLPWAMNVECIVCEEVCPTSPKAIWFEEKEVKLRSGSVKVLKLPYVEAKLCVGCGICENKCPVRDHAAIRVTSVGETRSKSNRMILEK